MVLLPLVLPRRFVIALAVVFGGVLLALQTDPTLWPTHLRHQTFSKPIPGYAVVGGLVAGALVLAVGLALASGRVARQVTHAALVGVVVVVAVAGFGVQRYEDDHRYTAMTLYEGGNPLRAGYRWAQHVEGRRIGVVGNFFQYPFTGPDQSNHVQYLSTYDSRGAPHRISTCREWRHQVNRGHYDFVVVAPNPVGGARRREYGWTASPATEVALRAGNMTIFRITGRLDPRRCPGP
jgi:hypothetical protein